MENTEGNWEVDDCLIMSDNTCIARVFKTYYPESQEANAHLIVAAVNACIEVNPDNPQAVAASIGDVYEALKVVSVTIHNAIRYAEGGYREMLQEQELQIEQALAKAEVKE